jgi:hypothetical protein
MSQGVCNKTSNNKYFGCPARMNDSRHFTDFRPNSYVNDLIRYSNNVPSSYNYRQFLIANASKIMNLNQKYAVLKNGNDMCNATPVKFQTIASVNQNTVTYKQGDSNGVGIRYQTQPIHLQGNNLRTQKAVPGKRV